MSDFAFAVTLPYKVRCELPECNRAVNRIYRTTADGVNLLFCSTDHAKAGLERWTEKKKLDIRPGVPKENPIENEQVADNLLELEGDE